VPDDVELERYLRDVIAERLQRKYETYGPLTWRDLEMTTLPDGSTRRTADPGRGGIWNPNDMAATLSIVTSPDGPYPDREENGLLTYHYQRADLGDGKNAKLRRAMELGLPVIRFDKVKDNAYNVIYPTYVVGDDRTSGTFTLALDLRFKSWAFDEIPDELERRYAEREVKQRVHQPWFRSRVMLAYERQCTVCVLKKVPLLDAAHIISDGKSHGEAVVTNGLALCKIHHAAYDANLLGITPDYTVSINHALLEETDGPMLLHGLQEMHGRTIALPRRKADQPDRERLDERYQEFLAS